MDQIKRRALMGDKEAQSELSKEGYVMQCPGCGGPAINFWCKECSILFSFPEYLCLKKQYELGGDVAERIQKEGRSCMETYLNFASQPSLDDKTSAFYRGAAAAVNDLLCQIGYGETVEDLAAHLQIGELTEEE